MASLVWNGMEWNEMEFTFFSLNEAWITATITITVISPAFFLVVPLALPYLAANTDTLYSIFDLKNPNQI